MQEAEFESWWRVAEERLRSFLRKRRVHDEDIDDLVQRVALRAVVEPAFDSERHLVGWSIVVLKNLMTDDGRRETRAARALQLLHAGQRSQDTVEDVVIARIKGQKLDVVIDRLPEAKRDLLLAERVSPEPTATRVAKHRVRKDLRAVYERLGVGIASWRLAVRRWWGGVDACGWSAPAAAAVALAVLGVGALGALDRKVAPRHDPPPRATTDSTPTSTGGLTNVRPDEARLSRDSTFSGRPRPAPVLKLSLGHDAEGNERTIVVRNQLPEEDGAAFCVGEPGTPNERCVPWPAAVLSLGDVTTATMRELRETLRARLTDLGLVSIP